MWGTDVYTDDSSVCSAAVHAGLITVEDGGKVVIEIAPAEEEYKGSDANGVESSDYGPWGGSFTFPDVLSVGGQTPTATSRTRPARMTPELASRRAPSPSCRTSQPSRAPITTDDSRSMVTYPTGAWRTATSTMV